MDSLKNLAQTCDTIFIHSSTVTHYAVINELLNAGVHVYVNKPLAENLHEAGQLVGPAAWKKSTPMVELNRQFVPLCQDLRTQLSTTASIRMDEHRTGSVGLHDLRLTLLGDYLHVVDTVLWLVGGQAQLNDGTLLINKSGVMLYAKRHFSVDRIQIMTSTHRCAGSQRESVQTVTDGGLINITNVREWREERRQGIVHEPIAG